MDEYVGGITANYMTNDNLLKKGLRTFRLATRRLRKRWCRRLSSANESLGIKA